MNKNCFKCQESKPLSQFYKHSGMKDGYLNKCKECAKEDVRKHRRENESVREYDRNRGSRQAPEYLKGYRKKYPKKYKAHIWVGNAVRGGRLHKGLSCEECSSDFHIEAHHDDYDKPEKVRWLCSRCHKIWHSEYGEGLNAV